MKQSTVKYLWVTLLSLLLVLSLLGCGMAGGSEKQDQSAIQYRTEQTDRPAAGTVQPQSIAPQAGGPVQAEAIGGGESFAAAEENGGAVCPICGACLSACETHADPQCRGVCPQHGHCAASCDAPCGGSDCRDTCGEPCRDICQDSCENNCRDNGDHNCRDNCEENCENEPCGQDAHRDDHCGQSEHHGGHHGGHHGRHGGHC